MLLYPAWAGSREAAEGNRERGNVTVSIPGALPASLNLDDKATQVFNVKAWGAKGDGITDDAIAIQNTVLAATSGGTVYFPPGTYKISAPLTILGKTNIALIGPGNRAAKIQKTGTPGGNAGDIIQIGSASSPSTDITISGLSLEGNSTTDTVTDSGISIALNGSNGARTTIRDNYITGTNVGVWIANPAAVGCIIVNNRLDTILGKAGNSTGYGITGAPQRAYIAGNVMTNIFQNGVYISGATGNGGQYNRVIGNYISGTQTVAGINLATLSSAVLVTGNVVSANILQGNYYGILLNQNAVGNTVDGNTISGSTSDGIFLNGSISADTRPDKNIISNNCILSSGGYGIHILNANYNLIRGNLILNSVQSGIQPSAQSGQFAVGNQIVGNTIKDGTSYGINIPSSADSTLIANNVVLNNTTHEIFDSGSKNTTAVGNITDAVGVPGATNGATLVNKLNVGGGQLGTTVTRILGGSATLNFGKINAQSCAEGNISVPGAVTTSAAFVSPTYAVEAGLSWQASVSSAGNVRVRVCNATAGNITPSAGATWRAWVIQE
jgi:parallel beta-helix repeat protein